MRAKTTLLWWSEMEMESSRRDGEGIKGSARRGDPALVAVMKQRGTSAAVCTTTAMEI